MGRTDREADRITSEVGSRGVAMEVTQPVWPLRVPRRDMFSAMVASGVWIVPAFDWTATAR